MKRESPKPIVYLALTFVALLLILSFGMWICSAPASGQEMPQEPPLITFDDYSGGINHTAPRGMLAPNEYLSLTNFLIQDRLLQCREGYFKTVPRLTTNELNWLTTFTSKAGVDYVLASDGNGFWYRKAISQNVYSRPLLKIDAGTCSTTFGEAKIIGSSGLDQKWRALLGTGEGMTITLYIGTANLEKTIDYVLSDSIIYVTDGIVADSAAASYQINLATSDINADFQQNDALWIYTESGNYRFNPSTDSVTVINSPVVGTNRTKISNIMRYCYPVSQRPPSASSAANGPSLWWYFATPRGVGEFVQISSHSKSGGNVVAAGHEIYTSWPILGSIGNGTYHFYTTNVAFCPESTSTSEYAVMVNLDYDPSTLDTIVADSIQVLVNDSTALWDCGSGKTTPDNEAIYFRVFSSALNISADTMMFATGDWFFAPAWMTSWQGYSIPFTEPSMCFPVIGGLDAGSNSFYVGVGTLYTGLRSEWSTWRSTDSCLILLYRMKQDGFAVSESYSYTWAATYDNRAFWSTADDPTLIKKSEPNDPETQEGVGFYLLGAEDDPPIAGLVQGDVLKVYCENSRHIVTSADGYLYTAQKLSEGVGCSSPKTLREHNGIHYYLHRTGVYADDGTNAVLTSFKVNSWFRDSIPSDQYLRGCYAAVHDNRYWISVPLKSGARKTLVYDLLAQAWTDMNNLEFTAAATNSNADDSASFYFATADSGVIMSYHGNLDGSDSITAVIQTDYVDAGSIERNKTIRHAWAAWDRASTSASFALDFYLSHSTTSAYTYSFTGSSFGSQRVNPPSLLGRNCSLKLTIDGASNYKHRLLKVGYEDKDLAN